MASVPLKLSMMLAPPRLLEARDTPVTTSPSVVAKCPRSIENEPGPANAVAPKKLKVMWSSVGDTVEHAKEPETPKPEPQLGGEKVEPTQKPGLAGSVCGVGAPGAGVISVLPVSNVLKL